MPRFAMIALSLTVGGISSLLLSAEPAPTGPQTADVGIPRALLEQRLEAARNVFESDLQRLQGAEMPADERLMWWSERWLNAQLALSEKPADQTAALEAHMKRLQDLERIFAAYARTGQGRPADASAATYFRIEAEVRLLEARRKQAR